mmetsp:Transcript_135239/g.376796  ORF Transcript_135239/g.376796 Transcript_135239/m.376796 type:complete len:302 (+) Transcript_135239:500-1405(+)
MNAHWRPGSQVVFKKRSMICPYLENSDLKFASVMESGSDPTKTFRGPSIKAGTAAYCPASAPESPKGMTPGFLGSMGSLPNMPWCLAIVTSHGLSDPGNVKILLQLFLAYCACSDVAKVINAHWRPGSHVVLMNKSTTCPYLENSSRNIGSVTLSGKDPTNIFLGCICASDKPPIVQLASIGATIWYVRSGDPMRGSWPNIPWCRASVTSQGLMPPGNCRTPFVIETALAAWSGLEKVTKAHMRPGSQLALMKTSSTNPYLENSARMAESAVPSGSDPTKIFLAGLPLVVGMAAKLLPAYH